MVNLALALLLTLITIALYRVWPKESLRPPQSQASARVRYTLRVLHRVLSLAGFAILLVGIAMLAIRGALQLVGR